MRTGTRNGAISAGTLGTAIRTAWPSTLVRAVPGADWVDVEDAGGPLPESLHPRSPVDRLYAAGHRAVQEGPEWDALRERIEVAIARALAGEEPEETEPPTVHPAPAGLRRWFRLQREA